MPGLSGLFISHSTIVGNQADQGGGIYSEDTSDITMRDTILWGNSAPAGPDCICENCNLRSDDYNLIGDGTDCTITGTVANNLPIGTDPNLGPLQDNGGPTLTTVPDATPAILQVGTDCPKTDQTGKPRTDPCTVGAVELE